MSETMTLKARTSASVAAVHHALTDAAALRTWLAEHAEVELPGRYEFWGRFTPEGDAPHQRPLHIDERTVRFAWLIDGEDTTVEFTLDDGEDGGTVISLSQSHFPGWEAAVAEASVLGYLQTYWCLAIANLVDHLEGRDLTPLCDFTSAEMREEVFIDAPPAAVFASLVQADTFAEWFGANVGIEPWVGGRFAMGGFELNPHAATISEFEADRRMTIDFGDMLAGWELEGSDGRTRLTLVQSGFDEKQPPYGAWMGWLSGIAELRRFHELPVWRRVWLDAELPGLPEGMLSESTAG